MFIETIIEAIIERRSRLPGTMRKIDKENPHMSCNLEQPRDCLLVVFTGSSSIAIGFSRQNSQI